jgi:hypothetical protein
MASNCLASFETVFGKEYIIQDGQRLPLTGDKESYLFKIIECDSKSTSEITVNFSRSLLSIWENNPPFSSEMRKQAAALEIIIRLEKGSSDHEINLSTYTATHSVGEHIRKLEKIHEFERRRLENFISHTSDAFDKNQKLVSRSDKEYLESQIKTTTELRGIYVHIPTISAVIATGLLALNQKLPAILFALVILLSFWRYAWMLDGMIIELANRYKSFAEDLNKLIQAEIRFLQKPTHEGISHLTATKSQIAASVKARTIHQPLERDFWLYIILILFSLALMWACISVLYDVNMQNHILTWLRNLRSIFEKLR